MSSKRRLEIIQTDTLYSNTGNESQLRLMPSKKYTPGGYEHIAVSMKKMFKQLNINVRYDSLENLGHNILSALTSKL